jgi:hypothetical protein
MPRAISPVEHGGLLWKPGPDATASAEEFIAARELIIALHREQEWSPWVLNERRDEYEAAKAVFVQWERAEADYRPLTVEEFEASCRAEGKAAESAQNTRWQAQATEYDRERANARLVTLQLEAMLRDHERERQQLLDQLAATPDEDPTIRGRLNFVERLIDGLHIEDETRKVGDPETVVDSHGRLPSDRRAQSGEDFRVWRSAEVQRLRHELDHLTEAIMKVPPGTAERAAAVEERYATSELLASLIAIPRPDPDAMCSQCCWPTAWHGAGAGLTNVVKDCLLYRRWTEESERTRVLPAKIGKRPPLVVAPALLVRMTAEEEKRAREAMSAILERASYEDERSRAAPAESKLPPYRSPRRRPRSADSPPSALLQPPLVVDVDEWASVSGDLVPPLGADVISRAEVFAVSARWKADEVPASSLLVAACMWRCGTSVIGIASTQAMLGDRNGAEQRLTAGLTKLGAGSEKELRQAFRSFGSSNHLPQMGSSVSSTLLYFAGYRRGQGDLQPLILDSSIASAFNKREPVGPGLPGYGARHEDWLRWLSWATEHAGRDGEPEDWEYLLATEGAVLRR